MNRKRDSKRVNLIAANGLSWKPGSRPCAKPVQSGARTSKIVVLFQNLHKKSTTNWPLRDLGATGWLKQCPHANLCGGDYGQLGIHFLHVGSGHSCPESLPCPQAEPSQRTDHCEHISVCEIPNCLCMRALPHVFLSLPMFLFVLCCFTAMM